MYMTIGRVRKIENKIEKPTSTKNASKCKSDLYKQVSKPIIW